MNIHVIIFLIIVFSCIIFCILENKRIDNNKNQHIKTKEYDYLKPEFKELTKVQVEDIHARGKITPKEKVKEWEDMDLCAPGDAIGSAAWKCRKFHYNCHDCLVDYANEKNEYVPFLGISK
jgi:hypothetical protein